jgi:hypothetical protein
MISSRTSVSRSSSATAPDFFTENTPTAVLVRQVLGAIAQFVVGCETQGRQGPQDRARHQVRWPQDLCGAIPRVVAAAKALQAERPRLSLRKIAARLAEQGYTAASGEPYAAMSVRGMILG